MKRADELRNDTRNSSETPSLNALALQVLERNKRRNRFETKPLQPVSGLASSATQAVTFSYDTCAWIAEAWQAYFNERAGIAEHCGGMTSDRAERMAYESCVVRWLDTHPGPINSDLCAHCGAPIGEVGKDVIAVVSGHWLHHDCYIPWQEVRRQEAIEALTIIGIFNPIN